jgi:hypothetical protein
MGIDRSNVRFVFTRARHDRRSTISRSRDAPVATGCRRTAS